ncbi:hypothetical protein SNK04_014082 [Fusarium graminearum]
MPEGVNVDEVKSDLCSRASSAAHTRQASAGACELLPQGILRLCSDLLAGNTAISQEEARAELGKAWGDDQAIQKNLGQAMRAVKAFAAEGDGAGSLQRLQEKYGDDPTSCALRLPWVPS